MTYNYLENYEGTIECTKLVGKTGKRVYLFSNDIPFNARSAGKCNGNELTLNVNNALAKEVHIAILKSTLLVVAA